MTFAELDALISAKPGAVAVILGEVEWCATMTDPAGAPWRTQVEGGSGVTYRGLRVWVASPPRVAVLDLARAKAEGLPREAAP